MYLGLSKWTAKLDWDCNGKRVCEAYVDETGRSLLPFAPFAKMVENYTLPEWPGF
jgi:hypothetical protein